MIFIRFFLLKLVSRKPQSHSNIFGQSFDQHSGWIAQIARILFHASTVKCCKKIEFFFANSGKNSGRIAQNSWTDENKGRFYSSKAQGKYREKIFFWKILAGLLRSPTFREQTSIRADFTAPPRWLQTIDGYRPSWTPQCKVARKLNFCKLIFIKVQTFLTSYHLRPFLKAQTQIPGVY